VLGGAWSSNDARLARAGQILPRHDLVPLFDFVRPELLAVGFDDVATPLDALGQLVEKLEELEAFGFRYPADRGLKKPSGVLTTDFSVTELVALAQRSEPVLGAVDALDAGLGCADEALGE